MFLNPLPFLKRNFIFLLNQLLKQALYFDKMQSLFFFELYVNYARREIVFLAALRAGSHAAINEMAIAVNATSSMSIILTCIGK